MKQNFFGRIFVRTNLFNSEIRKKNPRNYHASHFFSNRALHFSENASAYYLVFPQFSIPLYNSSIPPYHFSTFPSLLHWGVSIITSWLNVSKPGRWYPLIIIRMKEGMIEKSWTHLTLRTTLGPNLHKTDKRWKLGKSSIELGNLNFV